MPRLTIRLSDADDARLKGESEAAGVPVSQLVRERLGLASSSRDEWQEGVERRLSRLEELAGL